MKSNTKRVSSQAKTSDQFHLLFQSNPLPMWVYDLETLSFLDVNEAAVEHYGYSRAEFLKMRILDICPPEDVLLVEKYIKAKRLRLLHSGEWRHCKKDGSLIYVEISSHKLTHEGRKAALVMANDITENKLAHQALAKSEEQYRNLVENALVGVFQTNIQGKILYVNDVMTKIAGYKSPKALMASGSVLLRYKDPSDRRKIIDTLKRDGRINNFEAQLLTRSGESKWAMLSATLDGDIISGFLRDITGQKQIEESLTANEEKYRALVEQIPSVVYINPVDDPNSTTFVSSQLENLLGYSPKDWLNDPRSWIKFVHPEDRQHMLDESDRIIRSGEAATLEYRMIARDGRVVWIHDQIVLVRDAKGKPQFWQGLMMDITEQKLAEEELASREKRFRAMTENSSDLVVVFDANGYVTYASQSITRVLGYMPKDVVGKLFTDWIHPNDLEQALVSLSKRKQFTGPDFEPVIFHVRHHDGSWRLIEGIGNNLLDNPAVAGIVINCRDVTEQKQAEESRRTAEAKYRALVEKVTAIFYVDAIDDVSSTIYISPQVETWLGYKPEEWTTKPGFWKTVIHPDDYAAWQAENIRTNQTGESFKMEYRIVARDGRIIWIRDEAVLIRDDSGRPLYWQGVHFDITDRKQAEAELEQSHSLLQASFDSTADGLLVVDGNGRITSFNHKFIEMWRIPESVMATHDDNQTIAFVLDQLKTPQAFVDKVKNLYAHAEAESFDILEFKDGRIFERYSTPQRLGEKITGRVWSFRDVTARQKAEEALSASEAELNAIFASMPDVVLVLDRDGRYLKIAPTNPSLLHLPAEVMLGKRMREIFSQQKADELVGHIREALDKKETINFEYALLIQDRIVWFSGTTSPLTDDSVVWVGRDITARKQTEETLLASQELLNEAQRIGHIGSWELDLEKNILNWSDETYRMFEVAPENFNGTQEAFFSFVHPDDRVETHQAYLDSVNNKTPYSITHRLLFADGRIKYVHESCETFYDAIGTPIRSIGTVQDITERQQAGDFLQQRLRELSIIYDSSQHLQQILTPESLATELINLLKGTFNYEHGAVLLVDEHGKLIPFAVSDQEQWFKSVEEYKEKIDAWGLELGVGIIGWVAQHGQSVRLGDARHDPRYKGVLGDIRSELCVPLRVGENVIGVINVESVSLNAFAESDQRLLETLAAQIAIAIQNARLFEAEHLRRQEAETLRNAANALTSSLDLETVLNSLLDGLALVVSFNSTAVFLKENGNYRAIAARGFDSPELVKGQVLSGENILAKIIVEERRPLILPDVKADDRFENWGPADPIRGWMGIPLIIRDQAIGYLTIDSHHPNVFTEANAEMALAFASHAATAIHNARLYEDAVRRMTELQALHESGLSLGKSLEPREISEKVVSVLAERLNWHHAALRMRRGESEDMDLLAFSQVDSKGRKEKVDTSRLMPGRAISKVGQGMAGWVIQNGRSINSGDLNNDPRYYPTFPGMKSGLHVPIWAGGRALGCISVETEQPNAFTESDERLLTTLASQAASALENARLFAEAQDRIKELEALNRASQSLTGTLDLAPLLENILRSAQEAINGAEKGTILLKDRDSEYLRMTTQIGYEDERILQLPFNSEKGYSGRSFHEKRPILINDASEFPLPFEDEVGEVSAVKSGIVAPLVVKDEAIGVIALDNATRKSAFTENDLDLLMIFASSAASVIENSRLFEETRRRAEEFEALYKTAADVSAQSDLKIILNTIIERARILSGASGSGLYLFDSERGDLELVAIHDPYLQPGVRLKLGEGLSGRVAETKQPMMVEDYRAWEYRSPIYKDIPYTSVLGIPMLYSGELIGVLNVQNFPEQNGIDHHKKFSEQDISLLSLFANSAAGLVYSARLLDQTRLRLAELTALAETSAALRSATTRTQMTSVILEQLMSALKSDGAGLVSVIPEQDGLFVEDARGYDAPYIGTWISMGEGISSHVVATGETYSTPDVRTDPRLLHPELNGDVRAVALVPLKSQDKIIGAVTMSRAEKNGIMPPPFSASDMRMLASIADMAANALQRHSLHEETTRYAGQLVIINDLGRDLSESLDLPHIYEKLSRSTLELLPNTVSVFISLLDSRQHIIQTVYGLHDGLVMDSGNLPSLPFDGTGYENQSNVIYNGRPLIVPDLNEAIKSNKAILIEVEHDGRRLQSALYVPMKSEGRVIGVLQVQSYIKNRYMSADAGLLELIANTAASAIQNGRLFGQLTRRVGQLSALHSVDTSISSTTDLRVSLQSVLESVTRELRVDAADVLIFNPSALTLEYVAGIGFFTTEAARTILPFGKGQAGLAAMERRTIHISKLSDVAMGFANGNLIADERFVSYMAVPLMAKGEVKGVLELFHRSILEIGDDSTSFLETLANQAALAIDNSMLFEGMEKANIELSMAYNATIAGWSQALELRDQETHGHSVRVLDLALRLAAEMGIADQALQDIRRGILLHDIGKMGIPDSILHKRGGLTDDEWKIMRMHPQYAYDMLSSIAYLRNALDIPYCHHEKWDGSGYPRGLSGEAIPLAARIFCIVDVFDALTSDRPYREAWSKEKTLDYIREQTGTHFDPRVSKVFFDLMQK